MAKITVDSKIKDIMQDPRAVDIFEKYSPGFKTDKQMKLVMGLTYRALCKFPQAKVTPETLEKIDKELAELD